jgi:PST family polysaccharide transporter
MTLVKTSLLNSIAVAVRVTVALILNKILSVYVGPAGYAIIGQFQNAVSFIVGLSGGLMATGVTKATAQHGDDEAKQHAVWQTAVRLSIGASAIAGISLLFIGNWLSEWLLHRSDMSSVFVWLVLTLPALAYNNLLLAIVNGKKEIGIYVTANIIGSLLVLLVMGLLVLNFGLYGALIAYTITPTIGLLFTGALVARRPWFKFPFFWGTINRPACRELSGFCLMELTAVLVTPITYMLIRNHLTTHLGLVSAGYWQAIWKISDTYLLLGTTTLSVYYLPRLAEIRTASELKAEMRKVYRFVLPLVTIGAIIIFLMRDFIIHTLFTKDFYPMRALFPWQLVGDVIKIGSWIPGFIMLGRAMVKIFVITEIVFAISFLLLSLLFVNLFGLVGVSMAYAINHVLYWVSMWYLAQHEMRRMDEYTRREKSNSGTAY